jgi:hypothetical protein
MTGIKMTSARRSQLLEQLLKQNEAMLAGGAQSGGEVGLKLLAQVLRQKQIGKLKEDEAAANKTTKANEANLLKSMAGEQINSPMAQPGVQNDLFSGGAPALPQQPSPDQLAGLLGSENPMGAMYAQNAIKQHFAPPKTEDGFTLADGAMRFDTFGNVIAHNEKEKEGPLVNIEGDVPPDKLRDPKMLDIFEKGQAAASDAWVAVQAADNMLGAIGDGVFAGPAEGAATLGAQILYLVADKDSPPESIAEAISNLENSQFYDTQGGILVGQIIKLFGSGTGLSDADREYAEKIAGALRKMQPKALKRVLTELRTIKKADVTRWNNKARNIAAKDLDFIQPWLVGVDTSFENEVNKLLGE